MDQELWPTREPRPGYRPELEAEEMRYLRVLSRERREHELGYKLVALAHSSSLSLQDMAIATEQSESEITEIIQTFYAHELMCKRNAVAERLRRLRPQYA